MVQIIHGLVRKYRNSNFSIFISHMVQIIPRYEDKGKGLLKNFISHMVQIIRILS